MHTRAMMLALSSAKPSDLYYTARQLLARAGHDGPHTTNLAGATIADPTAPEQVAVDGLIATWRTWRDAQRECRAFASSLDSRAARAAADGYDLGGVVGEHLATCCALALQDVVDEPPVVIRQGTRAWKGLRHEERPDPSAVALNARAEVVRIVEGIERPTCMDIDVSRVERYRMRHADTWRTAIVVRVRATIPLVACEWAVIVNAEPRGAHRLIPFE